MADLEYLFINLRSSSVLFYGDEFYMALDVSVWLHSHLLFNYVQLLTIGRLGGLLLFMRPRFHLELLFF